MTHLLKMENPFLKDPNLTSLVISLKRHEDKLQFFKRRYESAGFDLQKLTILHGFDAAKMDPKEYPPMTLRQLDDFKKERYDHRFFNKHGGFGCYLSHAQAWKWCVDSGRPIFVFEDDAAFPYGTRTLEFIEKRLDLGSEKDVLFLIGYHEIPGYKELTKFPEILPENEPIVSVKNIFHGTHLYYITPPAAELLLKYSFPIEMQVDSYMGLVAKFYGLNCKAYAKPLLNQSNNYDSTIQEKCLMCNGKVNSSRFKIESGNEKRDVCKETGACGVPSRKNSVVTGIAFIVAFLGFSALRK
jgi:GR25 family glycosyltransferase involved in LPS biosynthesis